jgi:hypothetical protein
MRPRSSSELRVVSSLFLSLGRALKPLLEAVKLLPLRSPSAAGVWVRLHPMPRDLHSAAHPYRIVPLDVVHEAG